MRRRSEGCRIPAYSTRRTPYSSHNAFSEEHTLPKRRPIFLVISAFLAGWVLGRHDGTRSLAVEISVQSAGQIRSTFKTMLTFAGLAGIDKCENSDGSGNFAFCSVDQLLGKLTRERVSLERRLESIEEYGSYYRRIFNEIAFIPSSSVLPKHQNHKDQPLFRMTPESSERFTRRILIKHLQAVLHEGDKSSSTPPPTFTWVTAGDSAAAGHGNLYAQSYTAILQDTVERAFESVGINFVAKNYAMGQYSSGPELALCLEEVFGSDIDVLSWDFASLQETLEPVRRTVLWANRAGMHPTRPILFFIDKLGVPINEERVSENRLAARRRVLEMEHNAGTAAALMDPTALFRIRERLPDSNDFPSFLPKALRYYVCDGTIEGGVPCDDPMRNFFCDVDAEFAEEDAVHPKLCRENKFRTSPECIEARYKTSWHPGWKDHQLKGRLMGHFMINMLREAMFELEQFKERFGGDSLALLEHLEGEEHKDKQAFNQYAPDISEWNVDGATPLDMDPMTILRGESICHTALLPSKSRLEGITTESDKSGDEFGGFYKGENQFLMSTPKNGLLPLGFDMNDRQHCDLLEVDHKDFFLVREQDDWVGTIFPNGRELEVYPRSSPVQGIIVLCLKICPLNKCPDAYVSIDEISRRSKLFITVDGKTVTNVRKLDGCNVLEGEDGIRWGSKDQFELRFKIHAPGTLHVLKVSSMIVF